MDLREPAAELEFDAVIIGTGQAAPALAVALARRGERVAVIERGLVGGTCVNVGCTPTKTLRKSARVAFLARQAADFGVEVGTVRVDFAAAMRRMQQRVDTARAGLEAWLAGEPNITLLRAHGALDGRRGERFVVRAGPTTCLAPRVYLNPGARAWAPPIPGLASVPWLDNVGLLQLRACPRHLLILGGSYIGLEMGQIFRRLGAAVTIIEPSARVAAREDPDVSARIEAMLRDEGIEIITNAQVDSVMPWLDATAPGGAFAGAATSAATASAAVPAVPGGAAAPGVALTLTSRAPGAPAAVHGSHLMAATGRVPNTERLGLDTVGLHTDARGFIETDGGLCTAVAGIWALGDVNRRGAFTHTSYQDHEIVLANHAGGARTADGRVPTYAMFTDPPLGRVGLGEAEARALARDGRRFLVASHEMKDVSRAREEGETIGVIKLVVDAADGRIAGACVLGINGDEIIQVVSSFMASGARYEVLRDALPVHPTVTEFLPTVLGKLAPLDQGVQT